MFLALFVIGLCRSTMAAATFSNWAGASRSGCPSVAADLDLHPAQLQESPVFQRMKSSGKRSKSPISDSFFKYPNNKYVGWRCSARPPARAWSGTPASSTRSSSC